MTANAGVQVSYGVHELVVDAVGSTVADVRATHGQVMNIPANAAAVIRGKKVPDGTVIREGETVEFVKEAGVKG